MTRNQSFLLSALAVVSAATLGWHYFEHRSERKNLNHEACVEQARGMVTEFLRTSQADANKGTLIRFVPGRFHTPGPWNLEGSFYLTLDGTAQFTGGTEQFQLIIHKGKTNGVSQPQPAAPVLYISIPALWED